MSGRVPSGCPSPTRVEKSDSSSSRESESSIHFDFDSCAVDSLNYEGRIRPSSWDESDDDLYPDQEGTSQQNRQQLKTSVVAEINELKKQFFESLQRTKDENNWTINTTSIPEITSDDRRQCPARIRRRTKSSSSLSPVMEVKHQNSLEKLYDDETPSKILDFDPKYYLNNFFNEIRMKRISLTDPSLTTNKPEEEESNQNDVVVPFCDEFPNSESNENDAYFCKTSRKLSQIIEVEENRKDLEKSSEEISEELNLFSKSLKKPEENTSPLQTARSRHEKISEEFENFQKVQKPFRGSFSERSSKFLRSRPADSFSFLSARSPRKNLPPLGKSESKSKVVPFTSQEEPDTHSTQKEDEKENLDAIECLKLDLMKNSNSENPTPRSTDRSELSLTTRTISGKSRTSHRSQELKVDLDSERSLRLEDVHSPECVKSAMEAKTALFEDSSSRKTKRSTSRSGKKIKTSPETSSLSGSNRSYERPPNSRVESPESYKNISRRSVKTPSQTNRSTKSVESPKTEKLFDEETPAPELYLNITESPRSVTAKRSSRKSDRSSSCKSRHVESSRTSPKITPRTTDSISSRSKESIENVDLETNSWSELKFSNSLSNRSSVGTSRKNSWRNQSASSQKLSPQRGTPRLDSGSKKSKNVTFGSKNSSPRVTDHGSGSNTPRVTDHGTGSNTHKVTTFGSRSNSPKVTDYGSGSNSPRVTNHGSGNNTSRLINYGSGSNTPKISEFGSGKTTQRSVKSRKSSPTKFSPKTSEEHIIVDPPPEIEKFYQEVADEIISNKIPTMSNDENERETHSSRILENDSESERYSEKRLSIINEASIEDLEVSNDSNENEENSKGPSRSSSKGDQSQKPEEEPPQQSVGEKWNELIETFRSSPNSSFILENTFTSLEDNNETFWDSRKENDYSENEKKKSQKIVYPAVVAGDKCKIPQKYFPFDNDIEEKEEDSKNCNLDYEDHTVETSLKKDLNQLQNLYYVNVTERKPFGIGECGDVTNWNVDKSDTPEKPKGYGDGILPEVPSEVITILEKKEKEVKTQRHLWTDLRGDSRSTKQKLKKLFNELDRSTDIIPIELKTSKSDNCILRVEEEEICGLKNRSKSQLENPTAKNTTGLDLSIESLELEKDNVEFEIGTPRLSRSMIDLKTPVEKYSFEDVELNTEDPLFERTSDTAKGEKQSTNLNIFLARSQDKVKTNKWLNFKASDNKKIKKKRKSSKDKYQEYLYTGKNRSSIPPLKLRNPSCFQNFYKRIISVFCLTSHSSAATSK